MEDDTSRYYVHANMYMYIYIYIYTMHDIHIVYLVHTDAACSLLRSRASQQKYFVGQTNCVKPCLSQWVASIRRNPVRG